jgi:hypothetical protein
VAFGAGEYQPGTLIGDALLAHELAHVAQQGQSAGVSGPQHKGGGAYNALEEDADVAAVGAVASLWGGAQGRLSDIGQQAMPRLRSGLRLQRCGGSTPQIRSAQDVQSEFDRTRIEITGNLPQGETRLQLEITFEGLWSQYSMEVEDAQGDASRLGPAQQRLQTTRKTPYPVTLLVQMTNEYRINFTTGSTAVIEGDRAQVRYRVWSRGV